MTTTKRSPSSQTWWVSSWSRTRSSTTTNDGWSSLPFHGPRQGCCWRDAEAVVHRHVAARIRRYGRRLQPLRDRRGGHREPLDVVQCLLRIFPEQPVAEVPEHRPEQPA